MLSCPMVQSSKSYGPYDCDFLIVVSKCLKAIARADIGNNHFSVPDSVQTTSGKDVGNKNLWRVSAYGKSLMQTAMAKTDKG